MKDYAGMSVLFYVFVFFSRMKMNIYLIYSIMDPREQRDLLK